MRPLRLSFPIVSSLVVCATLAGCTVGPNFVRPAPPTATGYLPGNEQQAAQTGQVQADQPRAVLGEGLQSAWWHAFGSPDLDSLVERAMAHNQTLAASNATLAASLQDVRAIAGKQLPQIDANAGISQQQVNLASFGFSSGAFGVTGNPNFQLYSVGGGINYDLDLFGGLRRQVEQAAAQAEAQQRQTEAAHLTLAGQVVNQVLTIAAIRADIAVQRAILDDDLRNLDLTQKRRTAGEGTLVEVLNVQSQYTADRGSLPALEQQLAEARHLLAILVGVQPAELGPTDIELAGLKLPAEVPVTLPSALVHKRPDILQAEADLHASTAAIGVATAKLYPDITLGATLTQASPAIGNILTNGFRGYDIFAGLTVPIFHGGTLKAQKTAAIDRAQASQATYHQTVLTAFGQVADLLSALQTDARSVAMRTDAESVARHSLQLSRRSYQVGNSGILQVLDSERLYQRASADLVMTRSKQLLNVARLYVATAGGWIGVASTSPVPWRRPTKPREASCERCL